MKKLFIILGFIASILAVILVVTPLFKLALFPLVIAFLSGLAILYFSKKDKRKSKSIQYVFLLVIIALSFMVYKAIFNKAEIGDIQELEQREEESEEEAIDLLEDIEINE